MSRLMRDGTAETVSRDQILRHERGQGNIDFPCSADHGQDWQPYPVDPFSCYMCDDIMSITVVYSTQYSTIYIVIIYDNSVIERTIPQYKMSYKSVVHKSVMILDYKIGKNVTSSFTTSPYS